VPVLYLGLTALTADATEEGPQLGGRLFGVVLELRHELVRQARWQNVETSDRVRARDLEAMGFLRSRTAVRW
jgi:hypothetical protein